MRERRVAVGATQADVAEALGVSPKTISHWETGERLPDFHSIIRLAKVLGTSIAYLGGETDDPRPISEIMKISERPNVAYDPDRLSIEDIQELERVYLQIERRRQDKDRASDDPL